MNKLIITLLFSIFAAQVHAQMNCTKIWLGATEPFCPPCEPRHANAFAWKGGGSICMSCHTQRCPLHVSDPLLAVASNDENDASCHDPYKIRDDDIVGVISFDEISFAQLVEESPAIAMLLTHFMDRIGPKYDVMIMNELEAVMLGEPTVARAWESFRTADWDPEVDRTPDTLEISIKGSAILDMENHEIVRLMLHTYPITVVPRDRSDLVKSIEITMRATGGSFKASGLADSVPVYRIDAIKSK